MYQFYDLDLISRIIVSGAYLVYNFREKYQRGTCIKGLFWPPLEPKTESCFSPISSYCFVRRIAKV